VIQDFYKSIFPPQGLYVLAAFNNGLKKPPTQTFHATIDDLLHAAGTADSLGKNVYHGCAAYKTNANRKGENVSTIKALWLDLDVGPGKPYASAKEAATHYEQFRVAVGLPTSHVVASGNGVHEYQPFSLPIEPAKWDRLSRLFAQCLDHFGIKHDTSRTQDKASVLRIPGTSNYKSTTKAVQLKRLGSETNAALIFKALKLYATTNALVIDEVLPTGKPVATNDMVGNQNYTPSVGEIVASHCPIIFEVADSGGNVPYEIWWRAMGIAKHTTEPKEVAAHWTRNRQDTDHSKTDYAGAIAQWNAGPTTCAEFSSHSTLCSTCKFNGKVKTPLHLGAPPVPAIAAPITLTAPVTSVAPAMKNPWTFGAGWILAEMARLLHVGVKNGKLTRNILQEDGTYAQLPFCDRYWQVMRRVRAVDGTWKLEIGYEQYIGKPYKVFLLDSADVSSNEALKRAFSAHELHIYGGKGTMEKAKDMILWQQHLNYSYELETPTYPTLGWETVDGSTTRGPLTGEFILGERVFAPAKQSRPALLAKTVGGDIRKSFRTAGTKEEWVRLINHVYNRPGAEAYQFLIAASFAAPLVTLVPGGGVWHGIPIVVTGDSGAAKTTSCLVAMSIYGTNLLFNASADQGDTLNAMALKLGSLRNLPCVLDEMTGLSAEKLHSALVAIANGKLKDKMRPDGMMVDNPHFWDTFVLINTNDKLHEVLEGLRSQFATKATQLRTFEVDIYASELTSVFRGVHKTMIEKDILEDNYGVVGQEWIQFIANKQQQVRDLLHMTRQSYMIDPNDESAIRFYKDAIVTIKVAAQLAKKRGYINWDVDAMIKWAESKLLKMAKTITVTDWESSISEFVGSMHGRTIVTKHLKSGPGRRSSNAEIPHEPISTMHPPVARKAIEDKRFIFLASHLKEWCHKQRVQPSTMLAEMLHRDYLKHAPGVKLTSVLLNIGSGTTVTRSQSLCYEFNFDKVVYADSEDTVNMTNVVALATAGDEKKPPTTSGVESAEVSGGVLTEVSIH
jgi:hypothetical protein